MPPENKNNKDIHEIYGVTPDGYTESTSRSLERAEEDQNYIPVIIKRNDHSVRHPDDTLEWAIQEGVENHERSKTSLFLSSLSAGLILGFAGMCIALTYQLVPPGDNPLLNRLACAFVYPLGFVICVMSGTQLFTEQTATALYPVLDKKASYSSLAKIWGTVLFGNVIGTALSSYLLYLSDSVIGAGAGFEQVAHHLFSYGFVEVFISAILAGWLMAQGGWLILATPPASSQLLCIYVVTFVIGFGGLHHSIAGSAEVFSGLLHSAHPDYMSALSFLTAAILGNLVGGSFFVAILNYGHIRKAQ